MKKTRVLVIALLFMIASSSCEKKPFGATEEKERIAVSQSSGAPEGREVTAASQLAPEELPFKKGEVISYNIKSLGVSGGKATLTFEGLQDYNGKEVYLIVFTARAMNFFDEEKIYADKETFNPVAVTRDLNIWGKKEKITEEYDQEKGMIKITKNEGAATVIGRPPPIDNIYCFIYRYRKSGNFKIGDSFAMTLPTKDVRIKLVKTTKVKAAGQVFDAYYMESDPGKYKVWLDAGPKRIPLRINGAVGINDTAMIMMDYKEGE